jgi:tRNA(Ile)-lysidine synthase
VDPEGEGGDPWAQLSNEFAAWNTPGRRSIPRGILTRGPAALQRSQPPTRPCTDRLSNAMGKAATLSPVASALRAFFASHAGRTLLAVSGGTDSLALLTGAAELAPERIGVASLDHGLRPESAAEVQRVQALATERGLPFHTMPLRLQPGPGMEARARKARYAALEQIRVSGGYAWIATAHTQDDQAETLLMRLTRGIALRGAAGIRAQGGRVVRPLLGVGRADLVGHVAARGLSPARDPTNEDRTLLRARIRSDVLPALVKAAGSASVRHLAAFAARAAEDEALLAEQAGHALERVRVEGGLDAVGVRSLPQPLRRRLLVAWLENLAVPTDAARVARVEAAVLRGGRAGLPGGRLLRTEGGLVRIASPTPMPAGLALRPGTWVCFGRFRLRLEGAAVQGRLAFPLGGDAGPLGVRARRRGDRVEAPDGRRRAVQDVLVDGRVPAEERDAWPLLVDGSDRVLWVVSLWPPTRPGVTGPAVRAEPYERDTT